MISFVYFDVGGVVELDFFGTNKWNKVIRDMGIRGTKKNIFNSIWKKYEHRACIDFDIDSLVPMIEKECNIKLPKNYSLLDDIVDRFEQNPSMWSVIKDIHKICKIGLLTNMFPKMFKKIEDRELFPSFSWDTIIDSSVVQYQKPDLEIYELAEKCSKAKGKEILFIDNDIKNVNAAKKFGWKTFLYDSIHPVESSMKLYNIFTELR
jgi:FMN phosphatase YigB (HAD superfamily)